MKKDKFEKDRLYITLILRLCNILQVFSIDYKYRFINIFLFQQLHC